MCARPTRLSHCCNAMRRPWRAQPSSRDGRYDRSPLRRRDRTPPPRIVARSGRDVAGGLYGVARDGGTGRRRLPVRGRARTCVRDNSQRGRARMTDTDPCFLPVAAAAALIAAKQLSPVELTRAYLDRIEQLNGTLHAYVRVLHDEALAAARTAEAEIMAGRYRGPLHGIPIGLKEF